MKFDRARNDNLISEIFVVFLHCCQCSGSFKFSWHLSTYFFCFDINICRIVIKGCLVLEQCLCCCTEMVRWYFQTRVCVTRYLKSFPRKVFISIDKYRPHEYLGDFASTEWVALHYSQIRVLNVSNLNSFFTFM